LSRARAAVALVVAGAAGAALAGCSLGGDDAPERTRTVAVTTRVEVFRDEPAAATFDPQRIYRREAPGVVTVFSVFGGGGLLDRDPGSEASGSGFVLDGDGHVATNAHVVTEGEGGNVRRAADVYVQFADGNQVDARIIGVDPNSDIALLRVDPAGLTLRPLPLGTSRALQVGAPVAAIGSPYGEPQSLSVGVISGLDRSIDSLTGFSIDGAIQTDAAINRGNSGGPLVDARGRVLGINSQIRSTGGGGEGVGFAVPADTVRRVLAALRRDGEIHYAFLGVQTTAIYPQLAERFDLPVDEGAWVQGLTKNGPADDAGIRAGEDRARFQARSYEVGGDVVTRVDGVPVRDPKDLSARLLDFSPDDVITLTVLRDGQERAIRVHLDERPEDAGG
jgi:S1-C subfamily serine protease